MRVARTPKVLGDESGAVLVIVALSMIALLGMVVLVVDTGALLTTRREMVRSADAAALAGAISCARNEPAEMVAKANEFADANRGGAVATNIAVTPTASCGNSSGTIKVTYTTPQEMFFAPVLGLPESVDVKASSSATWGPSGRVKALPVMVSASALANCGFGAGVVVTPGDEPKCGIWYDDDDIGAAQWGFVNFDLWDVGPSGHCSNSGSASTDWIVNGKELAVNFPTSTYACADTGLVASDWMLLDSEAGKIKYFPIAIGQVDQSGGASPPGSLDKYDIAGFAGMRIVSATKKTGSADQSGSCSTTFDATTGQLIPLESITDPGCPAGLEGTIYGTPTVEIKNKTASEGTDYTYDSLTKVVTWIGDDTPDVTVSFSWNKPGETVTCGGEPKNSSSVCLVVSWPGASIAGRNPLSDGMDFGVRSVRLVGS